MRSNITNDTDPDGFATGFVAALVALAILAGAWELLQWATALGPVDAWIAWAHKPQFSVVDILQSLLPLSVLALLVAAANLLLVY